MVFVDVSVALGFVSDDDLVDVWVDFVDSDGFEAVSVDLGDDDDDVSSFLDDFLSDLRWNWPKPRGVLDVLNNIWCNWDNGGNVCW